MKLPQVILWSIEIGQPLRFTGPRDARIGKLQIIGADNRTLCNLPLQPSWEVQEPGTRAVCPGCLARAMDGK